MTIKNTAPFKWIRKIKRTLLIKNLHRISTRYCHTFDQSRYPDGINLIGNFKAQHGLGQSCRLIAASLMKSSIPSCLMQLTLPGEEIGQGDTQFNRLLALEPKYNINLLHVNPAGMLPCFHKIPENTWEGRYNIGYWLWELERFPGNWMSSFEPLDEIWTPSRFTANNLKSYTSLPVITIPYCVEAPVDPLYDRQFFGLPENIFLFLVMYDSSSTMDRKNPQGAIAAFRNAFSPNEDSVGLVLKINNAREEEVELLKEQLKDYNNIFFLTTTMEKIQVNSLIASCNVFVSLHRAEGFGLVMAEAMLVGTPAIATNWSSNTEFMNQEVACMVNYRMKSIEMGNPYYPRGYSWADPDIDNASEYMRMLFENPVFYNQKKLSAAHYIQEVLSRKHVTTLMEKRIQEINRQHS